MTMEARIHRLSLNQPSWSPRGGGGGGLRHTPSTTSSSDKTYINVMPAAIASRHGQVIRNPSSSQWAQALPHRSSSSSSSPDVATGISSSRGSSRPPSAKVPIIPQSQEVKKFIKEPSYSTLLQQQERAAADRLKERQELQQQLQLLQQQRQMPAVTLGQVRSSSRNSGVATELPPIYANCGNYTSNYSELEGLRFSEEEDLLLALQQQQHHHQMQQQYASPPSPVSSSYSELRHATKYPPGYHFQQLQQFNGGAANYESLYESVQASNYSLQQQPPLGGSQLYGGSHSSSSEPSDYFGLCSKCQNKIVGEGTGCSAMGRLYHIRCFTCYHCQGRLQGKPFYALDGQPYCQLDYMDSLEKCCKCLSPILERILRATGKPYHPQCFTCVVCSHSLDGVPFTVDATNQIHCIPCFHRRFAPKCSVCLMPIMPEPGQEETVRVVALDRSFHVDCYRCEDCALLLSSEEEGGSGCYPLDGHALCKNCNTRRIQDLTNGIGGDG